jgi:hypothetical protein
MRARYQALIDNKSCIKHYSKESDANCDPYYSGMGKLPFGTWLFGDTQYRDPKKTIEYRSKDCPSDNS